MPEAASALGAIVEDRILDGRLILFQPRKGHRAGSDAMLLAAAIPPLGVGPLLDIGAGVGSVGLVAAMMQPALEVVLLERDPDLATLARRNAAANGLETRVTVIAGDIGSSAAMLAEAGLRPAHFACVAMNPPYYAAGETRESPVPNRRGAHVADLGLVVWLKAARRALRPGGHLALIHRAQALPDILEALKTGFGGARIVPVHARADRPAVRVVVTALLNSKRPAELLPAFVLQDADGVMSDAADAIHRGSGPLFVPSRDQ